MLPLINGDLVVVVAAAGIGRDFPPRPLLPPGRTVTPGPLFPLAERAEPGTADPLLSVGAFILTLPADVVLPPGKLVMGTGCSRAVVVTADPDGRLSAMFRTIGVPFRYLLAAIS